MAKASKAKKSQTTRKEEAPREMDREEILRAFGASTSDMIRKAAVILEEEVASGILAAQEVERGLRESGEVRSDEFDTIMVRLRKDAHDMVNILGEQVDQMRSQEFDELSQRFQKDAHEVVDLVLNVMTVAPDVINRLVKSANVNLGGTRTREAGGEEDPS